MAGGLGMAVGIYKKECALVKMSAFVIMVSSFSRLKYVFRVVFCFHHGTHNKQKNRVDG